MIKKSSYFFEDVFRFDDAGKTKDNHSCESGRRRPADHEEPSNKR